MSAVCDLRPRLLANQLIRCGVPEAESLALVSVLSALTTNATRYAAAREVLRGYAFGPSAVRQVLEDYGMWDRECCAAGCGRVLGARRAQFIVRNQSFCSPVCCLQKLGLPV